MKTDLPLFLSETISTNLPPIKVQVNIAITPPVVVIVVINSIPNHPPPNPSNASHIIVNTNAHSLPLINCINNPVLKPKIGMFFTSLFINSRMDLDSISSLICDGFKVNILNDNRNMNNNPK